MLAGSASACLRAWRNERGRPAGDASGASSGGWTFCGECAALNRCSQRLKPAGSNGRGDCESNKMRCAAQHDASLRYSDCVRRAPMLPTPCAMQHTPKPALQRASDNVQHPPLRGVARSRTRLDRVFHVARHVWRVCAFFLPWQGRSAVQRARRVPARRASLARPHRRAAYLTSNAVGCAPLAVACTPSCPVPSHPTPPHPTASHPAPSHPTSPPPHFVPSRPLSFGLEHKAPLHRCTVASLHRCIVALLHCRIVASLYCCTVALSHRCIVASLYCCTVALSHRCIVALLHYRMDASCRCRTATSARALGSCTASCAAPTTR